MNAQRGSKDIALFSRWGCVVNATPQSLYPPVNPSTQRIGKCVEPRTSLNGSRKLLPTGIRAHICPGCGDCTILTHSNQKEVGQNTEENIICVQ